MIENFVDPLQQPKGPGGIGGALPPWCRTLLLRVSPQRGLAAIRAIGCPKQDVRYRQWLPFLVGEPEAWHDGEVAGPPPARGCLIV